MQIDEQIVKFRWLDPALVPDLQLPRYETAGSSGMDVEAFLDSSLSLDSGEMSLIPTGFAVQLPEGYELQVRPRSGLAVKHGITLINSPGTIDSDYRGEIKIGLINLGKKEYTVQRGDRIAQLVLAPVSRAKIMIVDELEKTERNTGGFGHTGD